MTRGDLATVSPRRFRVVAKGLGILITAADGCLVRPLFWRGCFFFTLLSFGSRPMRFGDRPVIIIEYIIHTRLAPTQTDEPRDENNWPAIARVEGISPVRPTPFLSFFFLLLSRFNVVLYILILVRYAIKSNYSDVQRDYYKLITVAWSFRNK